MARQVARFLIAVTTLLALASPATAQERIALDTFPAGTHLRFRDDGTWVKAQLVRVSNDTVTFAREGDTTVVSSMLIAELDQLQYGKGRNTKLGLGMAIGALVGAGLGIATAVSVNGIGFGSESTPASSYAGIVAVPALGGMLLGAGISALAAGEKWHPVNQSTTVQPVVTVTSRSVAAGVRIGF